MPRWARKEQTVPNAAWVTPPLPCVITLRLRVGTQHLKIAAIALANHVTLLTRNRRDFARIPGLGVDDWSV
jgi:hypothetical protein